MRMMSWSRYHCLSWSFVRVRAGLHCRALTAPRRAAPAVAISAAAAKAGRRRRHPPAVDSTGKGRPASLSDS
jgi:hypothetical protein